MPRKPRLCPPMGCVCLGQPGVWAVGWVCGLSPLPLCSHAKHIPPGGGVGWGGHPAPREGAWV